MERLSSTDTSNNSTIDVQFLLRSVVEPLLGCGECGMEQQP